MVESSGDEPNPKLASSTDKFGDPQNIDGLTEAIKARDYVVERLQPGGPPVDMDKIDGYVAGTLENTEQEIVTSLIMKWKDWYQAVFEF